MMQVYHLYIKSMKMEEKNFLHKITFLKYDTYDKMEKVLIFFSVEQFVIKLFC